MTGKEWVRPTSTSTGNSSPSCGSARADELMRSVFAELRLAFHLVDDPKALHEPYLQRNRLILQALQAGDRAEAEKLLAVYLDDSLERVVDAYRQRVGEDGTAAD